MINGVDLPPGYGDTNQIFVPTAGQVCRSLLGLRRPKRAGHFMM
jgi:hypothetical protein